MRVLLVAVLLLLAVSAAPAQIQAQVKVVEAASVCVYDIDAVGDTDWHTLTSASFFSASATDGTACAANRVIVSIMWVNTSGNAGRLKLTAAAAPGDANANRLVAPANSVMTWPVRGAVSPFGAATLSISFAKGDGADTGQLVVYVE